MLRTNSILAILNEAKIKLNVLKNTFPCGIKLVDDLTDYKINSLEKFIKDLDNKIDKR